MIWLRAFWHALRAFRGNLKICKVFYEFEACEGMCLMTFNNETTPIQVRLEKIEAEDRTSYVFTMQVVKSMNVNSVQYYTLSGRKFADKALPCSHYLSALVDTFIMTYHIDHKF